MPANLTVKWLGTLAGRTSEHPSKSARGVPVQALRSHCRNATILPRAALPHAAQCTDLKPKTGVCCDRKMARERGMWGTPLNHIQVVPNEVLGVLIPIGLDPLAL